MLIYALRNGALAMLMMPFVTWGMSTVSKELYAQGTAVMNTFKNISGAIGSAVVVGFMGVVTQLTAGSPHALMYGFNGAFAFVGVFTIFMMVIAFFFVKSGKEQ